MLITVEIILVNISLLNMYSNAIYCPKSFIQINDIIYIIKITSVILNSVKLKAFKVIKSLYDSIQN